VRIRHGYYNGRDGRCTDFAITPTPASAALIRSTGLQFRSLADGFSLFAPANRQPALAAAVAHLEGLSLQFLLVARKADFIGFTALPIDTCPTKTAFHVSNLATSGRGTWRQFGPRPSITADALVPVTTGRLPVTGRVAGTVLVHDLLGREVARMDVTPGTPAQLSLAGLGYGRYAISGEPAGAYDGPPAVACMPATPLALGMIELVLAPPPGTSWPNAAFPAATPPAGRPVCLTLAFDARPTYWNYFIVSGQGGVFGDDLTITGAQRPGAPEISFVKQGQSLPNGDQAVRFAARQAIPLQQVAEAQFSLTGQRLAANGTRHTIMVNHLPNAPTAPVWPAHDQAMAGISEIFVYV
jgi:hypothetical protein